MIKWTPLVRGFQGHIQTVPKKRRFFTCEVLSFEKCNSIFFFIDLTFHVVSNAWRSVNDYRGSLCVTSNHLIKIGNIRLFGSWANRLHSLLALLLSGLFFQESAKIMENQFGTLNSACKFS